jgi:hypothetical protein
MKKNRPRQGRRTIASSPHAIANPKDSPAKAEPTKEPAPQRPQQSRAQGVGLWWKEAWAYVGPVFALASAWFLLTPQVSIEAGVNFDPAQPLSTQFLITNRGHVPVYNLSFSCKFGGSSVHIGHLELRSDTIAPARSLAAGHAITRNCGSSSEDIQAQVEFAVTYHWPIIRTASTELAHFAIRRGAPGFFLVPTSP